MSDTPRRGTSIAEIGPRQADRRPAAVGSNVARGVAMGTADVIPGVSGGTIALILGIYPRLIAAIGTLSRSPTALLRGDTATAGQRFRDVPWAFVLPLGMGILTALGIGSVVLPPLLEGYPVATQSVFFGMIVGSLSVPWSHVGERPAGRVWAIAGVAVVVAFLITGLPEVVTADPALVRVFASAAVAICAMILPGVSGAFLLLALGIYEPTLEALRDLDLAYVGVFVAGAVVGLGAFSRLLGYLLARHEAMTMAALTGLMVGALRTLWPWDSGAQLTPPEGPASVVLALGCAAVGFAIVRGLLRLGRRADR